MIYIGCTIMINLWSFGCRHRLVLLNSVLWFFVICFLIFALCFLFNLLKKKIAKASTRGSLSLYFCLSLCFETVGSVDWYFYLSLFFEIVNSVDWVMHFAAVHAHIRVFLYSSWARRYVFPLVFSCFGHTFLYAHCTVFIEMFDTPYAYVHPQIFSIVSEQVWHRMISQSRCLCQGTFLQWTFEPEGMVLGQNFSF